MSNQLKFETMIEKINSKSRNTEVHALSLLILAAFVASGVAADERLKAIIAKILAAVTALGLAIFRIKSESELKQLNSVRTAAVRSFHHILGGFVLSSDESVKTEAEKVQAVFNHYGLSMVGKSYGNETSLIISLLNDLSSNEMVARIAALPPLATALEQLKTAHDAFVASRLQYEKAKAKEGNNSTATVLNKEVRGLINNLLISELLSSSVLSGDSFVEFADEVNQLIKDSNVEVKKRSSGKNDTKE